jgi:hypothetical protein
VLRDSGADAQRLPLSCAASPRQDTKASRYMETGSAMGRVSLSGGVRCSTRGEERTRGAFAMDETQTAGCGATCPAAAKRAATMRNGRFASERAGGVRKSPPIENHAQDVA